jgi:hypothetical protein
MSDFLTRYEAQLHEAARRELRSRRPAWLRMRGPRVAALGLVALIAAGVPATAQNGWFPFAGRTDAPTVTSRPPYVGGLTAMLSVLRRPQTEADRQGAEYALKFFGKTFRGVQIDYIRRARVSTGNDAVILVPAESHQLTPASAIQTGVICMWRTDYRRGAPEGGARACFEGPQIVAGRALQSVGHRLDMLVPNGVARVDAISPDGTIDSVEPIDNVASWEGSWPRRIVWYDHRGESLLTIAGR